LDEQAKADLKSAISNLDQTMRSVNGITDNMNQMMATNRVTLERTLANLDTTTANFAKVSDSLAKIETTRMVADLEAAIGSFRAITDRMEKGEGSIGKLLYDEQLYDNLAGASFQLEQLLEDFKENPKRYVHFSVFGKKAQPYIEEENPDDVPE
jgi:phospholipid/cholesterol/gamma-HCH transport system substrate-binding protein